MGNQAQCDVPQIDPEFDVPHIAFRIRNARALLDTDYVTLLTEWPTGIHDYSIHKRIDDETLEAINPLELIDTRTAVNILDTLRRTSGTNPNSWVLSRLLVQGLEYSRNRKHLIADPWDERTLNGDQLTQIANTDLARDLKSEQAFEFRLVRDAGLVRNDAESDYWGAFSRLPTVENEFRDSMLDSFCDQILDRLTRRLSCDGLIEIADLRASLSGWWSESFKDFDLPGKTRERRAFFKKLMSVAVRQVSSMLEQIAHAMVLRDASEEARQNSLFSSERERRLFTLRYGADPALGNINIGFLYDCGELHARLINDLANALVMGDTDDAWIEAEARLHEHVHLLGRSRQKATEIERDRKAEQRSRFQQPLPGRRFPAEHQADASAKVPGEINDELDGLLEHCVAVMPLLKPRDRDKVEAYIEHNGDFAAAAQSLGLTTAKFRRRWRETTLPNVRKATQKLEEQNQSNGKAQESK